MTTTLIIPCYWKNLELLHMTQDCLDSIKEPLDEIIIVDDGSPIDWEPPRDSSYTLIATVQNNGYSKAVNKALRASTGDILIVGNNDLTFPRKWLKQLVRALEEGFDIATCWTSDQDVKLEDRIEENAKFGSIFAMKREVYEKLGGFDEQFRGYFSDLDYRKRAMDAGFKIGKDLNLVIKHKAKATYKEIDAKDEEYLTASRLFEAKWGFIE